MKDFHLPQMRTHMKDFRLPQHSQSIFSRIGVVPARQIFYKIKLVGSLFVSSIVLESKTLRASFVLQRCHPNKRPLNGEKLKYHPFWGSPLFYKAPPRQFQPPKCKLTPSKIQIGEGIFLCIVIQKLQIGGRQSLFGGCQSCRVPIYILEAEIVLGVLYRKRLIPKKGGTFVFCD